MSQVSTSFPDSTYSASNKPSTTTLKADIQALETAHNETDTNAIRKDGTVAMAADLPMGGNQITNLGAPGAATDAASIGACWPIGSVFTSVVSTNPATLLGFGTWSQIAGGRVLIGQTTDSSGSPASAPFTTPEATGGALTATLTTNELPAHTHTGTTGAGSAHTHTQDAHSHTMYVAFGADSQNRTTAVGSGTFSGTGPSHGSTDAATATNQNESAHTHTFTTASSGTGAAFSILNPYLVVYFFKRTA